MTATFIVGRTDLRRTQWQEQPPVPLAEGAVRLHIDRFALTSNNITYGAFGEGMSTGASSRPAMRAPAASPCGASPR